MGARGVGGVAAGAWRWPGGAGSSGLAGWLRLVLGDKVSP